MDAGQRTRRARIGVAVLVAVIAAGIAVGLAVDGGPTAAEKQHQRDSATCHASLSLYVSDGHPLTESQQADYFGACLQNLESQP